MTVNPRQHVDPPDDPPDDDRAIPWRLRDVEKRLSANEKRVGSEMEIRIQMQEQISGERGLFAAIEDLTEAIKQTGKDNVAATEKISAELAKDRKRATDAAEERATFLRRTAAGLCCSLLVILIGSIASGALHIG